MPHPLHSRQMTRLLVTLIACAALIAGCGSDDESEMTEGGATARDSAAEAANTEATAGTAEADGEAARGEAARGEAARGEAAAEGGTAAAKPPRGPRVILRDSQFGPVLFDGHNRALYLFTRDPRRKTRCYGA